MMSIRSLARRPIPNGLNLLIQTSEQRYDFHHGRMQHHLNKVTCSLLSSSNQQRQMVTVTKTSATSPENVVEITKSSLSSPSSSSSADRNAESSSASPTIQDNDTVIITPSAVEQIHYLATRRRPDNPSIVYLRIYVDAGGCSGFQYKFEIEYKDNEETPIHPDDDVVFHVSLSDGTLPCSVVIDNSSLEYIQGSTIDYVREMVKSSFAIVDNPQSESACGCGSSFALKNFEKNPALD